MWSVSCSNGLLRLAAHEPDRRSSACGRSMSDCEGIFRLASVGRSVAQDAIHSSVEGGLAPGDDAELKRDG